MHAPFNRDAAYSALNERSVPVQPAYVSQFRMRVHSMVGTGMGFYDAREWCIETDRLEAVEEQRMRNYAVACAALSVPDESACGSLCEAVPFANAFHYGQRRAAEVRALMGEYGISWQDACDWVQRGAWHVPPRSRTSPIQLHAHIHTGAAPKTMAPVDDSGKGPLNYLENGKFDPSRANAERRRDAQTVESVNSAERHRLKRARHAESVCKKHGAFDWDAIPYVDTERMGTKARLERLEAAIMEMACHDPTGPFKSARDFLSLRVSKGLGKLLGRMVYTT